MRPNALSNVDDRFRERARGAHRSAGHRVVFNQLGGDATRDDRLTATGGCPPSVFNARTRRKRVDG